MVSGRHGNMKTAETTMFSHVFGVFGHGAVQWDQTAATVPHLHTTRVHGHSGTVSEITISFLKPQFCGGAVVP